MQLVNVYMRRGRRTPEKAHVPPSPDVCQRDDGRYAISLVDDSASFESIAFAQAIAWQARRSALSA